MKDYFEIMQRFIFLVEKTNEWLGSKLLPYGFILIMVFGVFEVVSRYFFNQPTIWVWETNALINVFIVALAGGYCLLRKSHVKVDIIYSHLPKRVRVSLDLVTSFFAFFFLAALLWHGYKLSLYSVEHSESSISLFAPPLYPFKIIMVIGCFLLFMQLTVDFMRNLLFMVTGKEIGGVGEIGK